jgi:crotonobetainyl-CoA:carnitine CoA-transferase CaiB-like acyl-CoA transferase
MNRSEASVTAMAPPLPLTGVHVIDIATIIAAPSAAKYLGDFGADVIKVEAPRGDPTRRLGWGPPDSKDSYYWRILGRNKRCKTVDLKSPAGLRQMHELLDGADVLIENFRPGTIERLGLAPDDLLARNSRLVILRVTGFGQTGPYASRPGFATLAEAMSGYAAISGEPQGGPLLPPIAITDEVTGLAGAFAVMVALWHVKQSGQGQVIDVNLIETLLQLMGPLIPAYAHLGYQQPRLGSGLPWSVPRGTYRCSDGHWIALSASADTIAERLMKAIGLGNDPRFASADGRMRHRADLESYVTTWVGERNMDEVISAISAVDAAVAPVYEMAEVMADPHFRERHCFVEVDSVVMPNVIARLSLTPGRIRFAGQPQAPIEDQP